MVQRCHLEDAEPVDDGPASELVRARQRGFPDTVQVILQGPQVLPRKLVSGLLVQLVPPR